MPAKHRRVFHWKFKLVQYLIFLARSIANFTAYNSPMRVVLTAAAAIAPMEVVSQAVVIVEDGVIVSVKSRAEMELPNGDRVTDFPGAILAPGFVDIHIHGGAGADIMSADSAGMAALERHLALHGVTAYVPTTVTAPLDQTLAALDRIAGRIEQSGRSGNCESAARAVGIHLEGPFISHEKRGVHPPEHIQRPSLELFERFWNASGGYIRILTIAPELPGAEELIVEAARRGVCVSLGHSNADYASACAGIAAGARHVTHTFNAMRALDHREPGLAGAALSDPRVTAEIICDGVHVAPAMIDLFLKAKRRETAVLVTDAISATGKGDGRYRLNSIEVTVTGNRCVSDEGKLAGSVLTLDRAVRNVMQFARWKLPDAVRLATANPARVLGLQSSRGALVAGARADIAVLSPGGDVLQTMIGGNPA